MSKHVAPPQGAAGLAAQAPAGQEWAWSGVWRRQAPVAGELCVLAGQVWFTRDGDPDDHVLLPGDVLPLRAGMWVTGEPWRAGQSVRVAWWPAVGAAHRQAKGLRVALA